MKKALILGMAAMITAVSGLGAIFRTASIADGDIASCPCAQVAVLRQGASGGEVKEV